MTDVRLDSRGIDVKSSVTKKRETLERMETRILEQRKLPKSKEKRLRKLFTRPNMDQREIDFQILDGETNRNVRYF